MRVLVVGAGVTGLLTAWYLRQEGCTVTVVEKEPSPARGTSFANGAQLSYSYVAPLAGPGVLPKIPAWLLRKDAPLRLRPMADWRQWRWMAEFVLACTARQSERTTQKLLRLAFYSRDLMHRFLSSPLGANVSFQHRTNGKLVVYSDADSFAGARDQVAFQQSLGCEQQLLGASECLSLEPSLASRDSSLGRRVVGGVYTPSEEVGDCYTFCVQLEKLLRSQGVTFEYQCDIHALKVAQGRVASALTYSGEIFADSFVLASGTDSTRLAATVGLYLPVYPLKGYSLTLPCAEGAPRVSVTDFARKIVYAPLDDGQASTVLRVAGLADLEGHHAGIDPARLCVLLTEADRAFPQVTAGYQSVANVRAWAGLRPATPTGLPILGRSRFPNLYLNTGHGALGWTLGHGSAKLVSDLLCGNPTAVASNDFTGS